MSKKKKFEYWNESNLFLKTLIPNETDKIIGKYIKKQKFTDDEARLFLYNLKDAFGFVCTIALLKLPSDTLDKTLNHSLNNL